MDDTTDLDDRKTACVAALIRDRLTRPPCRLLVVGCGSGIEAAILARELECDVTGVDIRDDFDARAAARVDLRRGDAMQLEFGDASFDFVYSYHALEHIPDPRRALDEMKRVLTPGGAFWVGTPNRSRWIGYLGSKTASWRQKLAWNLKDWRDRVQGRFENRFGAHAGFARAELKTELARVFDTVQDETLAYYEAIYRRRRDWVRRLQASGFGDRLFPSVYFSGRREPR